jgi:hypothetical protein
MASIMASAKFSWNEADETVDAYGEALVWLRPRGDRTQGGNYFDATESFATVLRFSYILMAPDSRTSDEDILLALPSVDEIIAFSCTRENGYSIHYAVLLVNAFVACAHVCEKLKAHERALQYASAGLESDAAKAGTGVAVTRVVLQSLQGRALAALGRQADAVAAFEATAEEAHRCGFYLYELLALRDMKVLVLDEQGHGGDHGARRLGAVLRLMTGPVNLLTPLLDGLDASELVRLPPPDATHRTPGGGDDELGVLRTELSALKLSALRKRAVADGVGEDAMEEAADGGDEKAALTGLIVAMRRCAVDSAEAEREQELRAELCALKLSALRKRAAAAGVDEDAMEAAADGSDEKGDLVDSICSSRARLGRD